MIAVAERIDAMSKLQMKASKVILNEMIGSAKSVNLTQYAEDSVNAMRAVRNAAEALTANGYAAQNEMDAAANTLKAAFARLTFVSGAEQCSGG